MTPSTLRQRLQGLAAALLILMLVVGTPLVLLAIGARPWDIGLNELRHLLSSPDDGTLAVVFISAVAWITWIVVALSVVLEAGARVRGLPVPSLPGLGLAQYGASELVAVAALLFMAAPTVSTAFSSSSVHAVAAAPIPEGTGLAVVDAAPVPPQAVTVPTSVPARAETSTIDYTVKRGDSLWRIAERLLGDGARYTEIVELNRGVLNGRPDFIVSGTVLKVPHEPGASASVADLLAEEYEVQPGDTLSGIAESKLGDPMRYPELFEASQDTIQRNGAVLTDPDLIKPGWRITIPGTNDPVGAPEAPVDHGSSRVVGPPIPHAKTRVDPTSSAEPKSEPESEAAAMPSEVDGASAPSWLLPGLTGAGALLAGLVLLAIRAHRNTQIRYRRPGQQVASPPPDLRAVEKTAFVSGAPVVPIIERFDQAMRALATAFEGQGRAMPVLATAVLAEDTATLLFAEDADLPDPWTGGGKDWSAQLGSASQGTEAIAPYPLLVSVGQDDAGGLHLVNLEHLGVASLTGDSEVATALARHLAAELALNPWSVLVDVNVIGLGEELAELDTLRLHHHADGEKVITSITQVLTSARDAGWGDPDPYWAVITSSEGTGDLAEVLTSPVPRLGAALVTVTVPVPASTMIELDSHGRLRSPALGLDLQAAGLTTLEASACSAIVDLTREGEAVPIPPVTSAADGWRALTDHAGALREELTDTREVDGVSEGSLLPNSADEYVNVAATTPDDVATLAPVVSQRVRRRVEESDPSLDEDLADWFDPDCERPRLTLLGPVNTSAYGVVAPAITKRKPYFVELLAFLALHPEGVTGSTVADAFSIAGSRARTDLGLLRAWLGVSARTGLEHLPPANDSPAYRETGIKTYQVQDILVDLDLFRRLRARGEACGAEGMEDLRAAMNLVNSVPFSNLRERGWSWLLDGERLHETIGCSIVDTAHIIVVDALSRADLSTARETAEKACKAAPYDDICRLDLIKVITAEGHEEAADRMLAEDVFNRTDDYLPPIDLPARTGDVVGNQRWGSQDEPETPDTLSRSVTGSEGG